MAQVLFAAIGTALGGGVGTLAGAVLGSLGSMLGSLIDRATWMRAPSQRIHQEGPRLGEAQFQGAQNGAPIVRAYGWTRLRGNLIWLAPFTEHAHVHVVEIEAGKGGGGGTTITTTTYTYTTSFAVGLCEGPVAGLWRVWADTALLYDATVSPAVTAPGVELAVYSGSAAQDPDPTLEAALGAGQVPACRGLAYLVLKDYDVTPHGNRVPQIAVELQGLA
jgi:hypothetical protein